MWRWPREHVTQARERGARGRAAGARFHRFLGGAECEAQWRLCPAVSTPGYRHIINHIFLGISRLSLLFNII